MSVRMTDVVEKERIVIATRNVNGNLLLTAYYPHGTVEIIELSLAHAIALADFINYDLIPHQGWRIRPKR